MFIYSQPEEQVHLCRKAYGLTLDTLEMKVEKDQIFWRSDHSVDTRAELQWEQLLPFLDEESIGERCPILTF